MTYQLDLSIRKAAYLVELQVFQVCKALFTQAAKLFYSKRTFSFTSALAIPTAAAFFANKSRFTLGLIQSVEICIQELLTTWSITGDYPEHNYLYFATNATNA